MTTNLTDKLIAWMTLISGLTVSSVAIYYSVAGLVSIFAAAVIPITIMGIVLETSKLVATVWLKWNWRKAPQFIKGYLLTAIIILMMITSMGIFGFLSKAHLDQAVPAGDVADKVALIDEKIKTQKENIDSSRKALTQMDAQVNERLSRSDDEKGAERAVQIRRQQAKERSILQSEIAKAQTEIAKLNEERAPIAKELRAVEAEVGPIKYIAALIYGDNPDTNLLEKAVRWVIIVIVMVFDPLAVILLLSSQYSFQWFRQIRDENPSVVEEPKIEPKKKVDEPPVDKTVTEVTAPPPLIVQPEDTIEIAQPLEVVEPEEIVNEEVADTIEDTVTDQELVVENSEFKEDDDQEIIDGVSYREKEAMHRWKEENPRGSLKLQRKMLAMGRINRLPWEDYLQPEEESQNTYVQNQEQSASSLWQRVKNAKGDE